MRTYYENNQFIDLGPDMISSLLASKHIISKKDKYWINREHSELKYLYSEKLKPFKRKIYLDHIVKNKFVCEDCGKKHSFQIRPVLEKDGSINFKKIANVCVDCRQKFMGSKDILVPQFKKKINWKNEKERVLEDMKDLDVKDRNKYFKLSMEIVKIEKFAKLILPPIKSGDELYDLVLSDFRSAIKNRLGENIDLDSYINRRIVRDYLESESGGRCMVCGKKHSFMTIDHIVAKDLGGKDDIDNFIGMCKDCNTLKDNESVIEFFSHIELNYIPNRVLLEAYKQQKEMKEYLEKLYKEREALSDESA